MLLRGSSAVVLATKPHPEHILDILDFVVWLVWTKHGKQHKAREESFCKLKMLRADGSCFQTTPEGDSIMGFATCADKRNGIRFSLSHLFTAAQEPTTP